MITYLKIDGFKSFHHFEMEFTPLTVIAGANASGKSNLFDALQLLSRLAEMDLKSAFGKQRGLASELFTRYGENGAAEEMSFVVDMLVNRTVRDNWGGEVELKYTRLRYELNIGRRITPKGLEELFVINERLENLKHKDDAWVKHMLPSDVLEQWRPKVTTGKRGIPYIYTEEVNGITTFFMPQDGTTGNKRVYSAIDAKQTVLSSMNSVDFPHVFAVREEMRQWKFLQLNPEDLREPTRQEPNASDMITQSGKNLAAALFRIIQDDEYALVELSRTVNAFLPNFTEVAVRDDKANKQFIIFLKGEDGREFSSRVLSEGTLRLLALCIFLYDRQHRSLLCFEEPENGIHPFRIETMARLLKDLTVDFSDTSTPLRQVIVNTHSPVLVSQLLQWKADRSVSVWFSQLVTLITEVKNRVEPALPKIKMRVTKILPVIKERFSQLTLSYSENERKLTLSAVMHYLQTADADNVIKDIQS